MTVYCIGNFDGVHPGHLALIEAARAQATTLGQRLSVLTFEPHPRAYFAADRAPFRLTNAAQREAYLQAAGVGGVVALPFDRALAELSAEEFASAILRDQLGASHVFAGENFHFGKARGGDMGLLAAFGRAMGFGVTALDLAENGGRTLSSSRIRAQLVDGDYGEATALWGRNFTLAGRVLTGDQLGRTLGFPTANLDFGDYLRPRFGVYASRVTLPSRDVVDGITNLGRRPTVAGVEDRFETHVFDFAGDLYGQTLSVELTGFIRGEQKFNGLDALKAQIAVDCATAHSMLQG